MRSAARRASTSARSVARLSPGSSPACTISSSVGGTRAATTSARNEKGPGHDRPGPSTRGNGTSTQDAGGGGGHGVHTLPPPTMTTPPSAVHAESSWARLALDCVQSALALHGAPPLLHVPATTLSAGFGSLQVPSW